VSKPREDRRQNAAPMDEIVSPMQIVLLIVAATLRTLQGLRIIYKKFYGLTRNPFEISPDPFFFTNAMPHPKAFSHSELCCAQTEGFVGSPRGMGYWQDPARTVYLDALHRIEVAFAFIAIQCSRCQIFSPHVLTE